MLNPSNITPVRDLVIVKMVELEVLFDDLVIQEQSNKDEITTRKAEVISTGPDVDNIKHCAGLKVGEIVVFTEFAGYFIPTDEGIYKVVRGYDIIGKFNNEKDMKDINNLTATADRLVIEIGVPNTGDDIVLEVGNDPRVADLVYGRIKSVSPNASKTWSVGQGVAFPPYAGTTVRHNEGSESPELRVVVEQDLLFTY